MKTPIDSIITTNRLRADLGDLDSLATSLKELGLIEPIVINQDNKLIAGGRRLAAAKLLAWTNIDTVLVETLDEGHRKELELEENIRRKDMNWQERVLAIAEIHELKQIHHAKDSEFWGAKETASLLNLSHTNVHYILNVAKELKKPNSFLEKATGLTDAIGLMIRQKEDEAVAVMASRTLANKLPGLLATPLTSLSQATALSGQTTSEQRTIPLSQMLFFGDSINVLNTQFQPESVDHAVTDPPYGIDMSNLAQENTGMENIDRVENEHDVYENLELFAKMFPAVYRVLKPNSFFVFWYDLDHHEKLQRLAIESGFRVQRWPLVWIKSHTCMNQQASKNFTKTIEVAMLCAKGTPVLVQSQARCHIEESNEIDRALYSHPFVKPLNVWLWILRAVATPGSTILDPFAGVGSCPRSALVGGYQPLAIEKNEQHYNRLVENISGHYKKLFQNNVTFV